MNSLILTPAPLFARKMCNMTCFSRALRYNALMEWENLLSTYRIGRNKAEASGSRSEFNKDYGRVLYSSAFRRLQDKTQVFPIGRNDYVRTRMTHSLEVANVGRALAKKLHEIISLRSPGLLPEPEALEDILATVCLAHDIGNPPFGHSGEDAINTALRELGALSAVGLPGYVFEGNAQGFRLLSKICDPIKGQGLDLTAATLAAFTKYPCSSESTLYKKFGIMPEELDIFRSVASHCGLAQLTTHLDEWARHPLALLMEAADDISYLIADIEDAFFSHIISYEECITQLASMAPGFDISRHLGAAGAHEQASRVHLARALAVGSCIERVADVLDAHYDDIMSGVFVGSLVKSADNWDTFAHVKDFSVARIYNHESVLRIEIAGFNVIKKLLELYMYWVTEPLSSLGRKVGDILHAPAACCDPSGRFLHVIDYVSGMTDSYALQTYNKLFGRESL